MRKRWMVGLVLLIGCKTAFHDVAFQGLLPRFLVKGASCVVASVATIRGPEAAGSVRRLVEELAAAANRGDSLGDALLHARRALVARRDPIGLALVSYGDIDLET